MRIGALRLAGIACALLFSAARGASAQQTPPQVNQNCTVSVLNRTVTANADGTWILPNVPANFGPVRARVTCVVNGQTISGESDPFTVPANGAVNIPQIHFGQTTAIPTALTIAAPSGPLTQSGATLQLAVTARYPDNSTNDVTAGGSGTTYTVTNPAIATVSGDGVVQAISSGTVIVQASHEGASGMTSIRVALGGGSDSDNDGIPDADELALGLNPNNPIDAMEDFDRDNLTNLQEYQLGTDLRLADSDGDGLRDGDEVARGTNPLLRDTDGDGISDGLEVQTGSDPRDPASYNLAGALSSIVVSPSIFTVTFNTIAGDASVQLKVTGTLRDNTTLDLTSTQRGTSYSSNDLNVCNFGSQPGRIFAGISGGCTVTATVAGFTTAATGTVTTFAPVPLSSVALAGPANGVDVSGDFVYVAVGSAGFQIVSVVNRSAPQVVATLSLLGTASDVKVDGTRAFVAAGAAGLHVVDVSNPLVPRLLGSVDTPGDALDVRARGNLVFVADGSAGLKVIDVSNPAAPRIVGGVATAGPASGVDATDALAVVSMGGAGVQTINVIDPAHPFVVGAVDTPGEARDVVVNSGFAYVADYTGSLRAIDIRNAAAPVLAGTTPQALGGILLDVARMDNFIFGADIFFVNGVPIVDVADANSLRPRAILNFPGDATGLGIAVDGSYVYLGTDTSQLYIGQYRIQQDLGGVAPTVTISTPVSSATFVEGELVRIAVQANDDLAVSAVTLRVNGTIAATDTTAPYEFNVTAPTGGGTTLTLGAEAVDLGNNTGVATDVVVNVILDPLTSAQGRVVIANGTPVAGASVTCVATAVVTLSDGTFTLDGLSTVRPVLTCTARYVDSTGTILAGASAPVAAIRGGITSFGDIVIAPVPIVASITPNVIDAARPPVSLALTGSNLVNATFHFAPDLSSPAIVAGAATVNPSGTAATLPITVASTARGRFMLVGDNTFGTGDTAQTTGNTVTLINGQDDVDSDGDGFPDGLELLFGSDPSLAASTPNLTRQGDVSSSAVSVVNRTFPSTFMSTRQVQSSSFSVVNRLFPSTFTSTRQAQSPSFSVVNRTFPSALTKGGEVVSLWFSLLNDPAGSLRQQSTASSAASAAATAVTLEWPMTGEPLIEGQTVILGVSNPGDQVGSVEFSVNGVAIDRDATAPYELLFTVPAGVSSLTFGATVANTSGGRVAATPLDLGVVPDFTIAVSGRVVDSNGNPVAGAAIETLSEGADAEFFDFTTPLNELPDLTGRTPDRTTRMTAVNMRNEERMFGDDPLGSRLLPDYAGRVTGWLAISAAGVHTFVVGANEGARLRVGNVTVVDMMGGSGEYREQQGQIALPAGLVPFQLEFYQSVGNGGLKLSFAPPDGSIRTVSPSLLIPSGRVLRTVTDATGQFRVTNVPTALSSIQVRATTAAGRSALSELQMPTPTTDIDIGDLAVAP